MIVEINIKSNIQIPRNLYNEAVELFLNHLEKVHEEQLLKGDNSFLTSQGLSEKKNTRLIFVRPQFCLGQSSPLRYKKGRGIRNVRPVYQTQL
jgi:hypothetical protein